MQAQALLKGTDAQATARWQKLDEPDLDAEITAYRESISELTRVLQRLGVETSADEEQTLQQDPSRPAGIPGVEVQFLLFEARQPACSNLCLLWSPSEGESTQQREGLPAG